MNDSESKAARNRRRRKLLAVAMPFLLIAALPHIVAKTALRDVVLNRLAARSGFHLATQAGSFGWFSPVRLSGIAAEKESEGIALQVDRVELARPWLSSWMNLPALGSVVVEQPEIDIVVPSDVSVAAGASPARPKRESRRITGTFQVHKAALRLLASEDQHTIVALSGIDLGVSIKAESTGRVLKMEPLTILDHTVLTPEVCGRGLQLIAPVLANATDVNGEASLVIHECKIPLDLDDPRLALQQADVRGTAQLHQVTTSLKHSLLGDSVAFLARLFRVELPSDLRIADDTEVAFALQDGRVHHEGLAFLIPEISPDMVWQTNGSVGLDETLDLTVQVQIPFSLAGESPLTRQLTERPIKFRITGTLADPKLSLPQGGGWLGEAAGIVVNEALPDEASPLMGTAVDLLRELRTRHGGARNSGRPASVLDQMRRRLRERFDPRQPADNRTPGGE